MPRPSPRTPVPRASSSSLALSEHEMLALERTFIQAAAGQGRGISIIRIFNASLAGADDISGVDSLRGRTPKPVRKRLLLDLSSLKDIPPGPDHARQLRGSGVRTDARRRQPLTAPGERRQLQPRAALLVRAAAPWQAGEQVNRMRLLDRDGLRARCGMFREAAGVSAGRRSQRRCRP